MRNVDRKQLIIKVTSAVTGHLQRAAGRDGGRHSFGLGAGGGGREERSHKEVALEPH